MTENTNGGATDVEMLTEFTRVFVLLERPQQVAALCYLLERFGRDCGVTWYTNRHAPVWRRRWMLDSVPAAEIEA